MKIRFPGYVPEKMPSGETRHRVRIEGQKRKRITIPVGPNDPQFSEHYYAARAGVKIDAPRIEPAVRMSADELVRDYLLWMEAQVASGLMSPLTLKQRRSLLKRSLDTRDDQGDRIGDLHQDLPPEAFVLIRDSWGAKTSQADNALKGFSACYKWAKEYRGITYNPVASVRKVHVSKGGAVPWSADDLRRFAEHHPSGTTARRWLMLALFTGSRIGDTINLGNEATYDGRLWLEWQPAKKGSAYVSIPLFPQLIEELRATKVEGRTYLLSQHGRPYRSTDSLRNMIQDWTRQAGL
ncbi:MAG: site-specific integrase, partial [Sulfitobacter sp.]|nr:site-specific integrase [Sulfitobacter sp.]